MIRSCLGKCKHGYLFFLTKILPPSQNIGKSWSTKVNVFGLHFEPNTSNFFDSLSLIFCDGESI
jgi:hypothetical protein